MLEKKTACLSHIVKGKNREMSKSGVNCMRQSSAYVSSQLDRKYTLILKTWRKVSIKIQINSFRWNFPLSFCLMKLTPGGIRTHDLSSIWRQSPALLHPDTSVEASGRNATRAIVVVGQSHGVDQSRIDFSLDGTNIEWGLINLKSKLAPICCEVFMKKRSKSFLNEKKDKLGENKWLSL